MQNPHPMKLQNEIAALTSTKQDNSFRLMEQANTTTFVGQVPNVVDLKNVAGSN